MLLAPRHLPRLAAMVGLFTRYGLADFARAQGLKGIAPDLDDVEPSEAAEESPPAARFRRRLVELGPAYVKLGQVLSTRPDLLPETYIDELESLQDDLPPIAVEEVIEVMEADLCARL